MSDHKPGARRGRSRRLVPAVWAASAVSAVVLALGVSGTLSAWTSAVITNDQNTVATAAAVILKEVGPDGTSAHASQTCFSSTGAGNSYTCSTINKYGGITTPLAPNTSQTTDVTFTNVGTANGSSFTLTGGTCTSTPTPAPVAGGPTPNNLCTTTGELTVAMTCYAGGTATGTALTGLVQAATNPGTFTKTYTLATGIASGASVTCRFVAALPTNANVLDQGVVVSQPLTWTLIQ